MAGDSLYNNNIQELEAKFYKIKKHALGRTEEILFGSFRCGNP